MKFIVIILARKNSKRLKNKNLLVLKDKPLVSWTIDFCRKIFDKNQILLSTDSEKIRKIGLKKNILCPWLRPKKLSNDSATSEDACLHAISWYEKKINKIQGVILMQPTTPFRDIKLIKSGIKKFLKIKKSIIGVSERKFLKSSYHIKDKDHFNIINNKLIKANLTNKKKLYNINGSFYATLFKNLKRNKSFYDEYNVPLIINSTKYSIDIDNLSDFKLAKKFIK